MKIVLYINPDARDKLEKLQEELQKLTGKPCSLRMSERS
jgi:hypothetical protein